MQRLSSLKRETALATIVAIMCAAVVLSGIAHADIRTKSIVTVYSEGKIMATYKAVNRGRMDDRCYVFNVRQGVRDLEIRVCGTFTVEDVR
jgi:hypothetical protein